MASTDKEAGKDEVSPFLSMAGAETLSFSFDAAAPVQANAFADALGAAGHTELKHTFTTAQAEDSESDTEDEEEEEVDDDRSDDDKKEEKDKEDEDEKEEEVTKSLSSLSFGSSSSSTASAINPFAPAKPSDEAAAPKEEEKSKGSDFSGFGFCAPSTAKASDSAAPASSVPLFGLKKEEGTKSDFNSVFGNTGSIFGTTAPATAAPQKTTSFEGVFGKSSMAQSDAGKGEEKEAKGKEDKPAEKKPEAAAAAAAAAETTEEAETKKAVAKKEESMSWWDQLWVDMEESKKMWLGFSEEDRDSDVLVEDQLFTSDKSFAELAEECGLSHEIQRGLDDLGYKRPSKIQQALLPHMLSKERDKRNVIAQGQCGTGKTAAYVLGMFYIVRPDMHQTQAICLEPSRELARQTWNVCTEIGKYVKEVEVLLLVPGVKVPKKGVRQQIVVGTAGVTLKALLQKSFDPRSIMMLVVDEADNMLQANMGKDTVRLRGLLSDAVKVVLVSATFNDKVREFAQKIAPRAINITVKRSELVQRNIVQMTCRVTEGFTKLGMLHMLNCKMTVDQAIIFVNKRETCELLRKELRKDLYHAGILHGGLDKEERDQVMDDFLANKYRILVTTNVVARGFDNVAVSLVINYDFPWRGRGAEDEIEADTDTETYLHRIGRTARFGRKGAVFNLIETDEEQRRLDEILHELNCWSELLDNEDLRHMKHVARFIRSRTREEQDKLVGLVRYHPATPYARIHTEAEADVFEDDE